MNKHIEILTRKSVVRLKYSLCMGLPYTSVYILMKLSRFESIQCDMLLSWMIEASPVWFGALVWDFVRFVREKTDNNE